MRAKTMPNHILNGYRVLDMTHVLAGPSATRLMAEMGAEVIKVEFPTAGDITRALPAIKGGRSAYFAQQNRGKKSVCLDLKADSAKEVLRDLIKISDVFIENFAPGVISRLGFSWEEVRELNPEIIMCSISAFGQEGELSALPGFDYIAQAYSGIMGMIGEAGGPPSFPMAGIGDVMTGAHAACAIGFALLHRERGGHGQYLDISLLDSYMHCHEMNIQAYSVSNGEIEPTRSGHHHYAVCPLGLFKGKTHYICIIALQNQWPGVCRAIGRPDLITDSVYETNEKRLEKSEEVIAIIQDWLDLQESDESILASLEAERVPCAPVLSISEVVNTKHILDRGVVRPIQDPKLGEVLVPGMPLRFSEFEHNQPMDTSFLGEDNKYVLEGMLGYEPQRIKKLTEEGVLFENPET